VRFHCSCVISPRMVPEDDLHTIHPSCVQSVKCYRMAVGARHSRAVTGSTKCAGAWPSRFPCVVCGTDRSRELSVPQPPVAAGDLLVDDLLHQLGAHPVPAARVRLRAPSPAAREARRWHDRIHQSSYAEAHPGPPLPDPPPLDNPYLWFSTRAVSPWKGHPPCASRNHRWLRLPLTGGPAPGRHVPPIHS
jgi:hypothetical protein